MNTTNLDFTTAITFLMIGKPIQRASWKESFYCVVDGNICFHNMYGDYIQLGMDDNEFSLDDITSNDWAVVKR